jgi:hypothetical protein
MRARPESQRLSAQQAAEPRGVGDGPEPETEGLPQKPLFCVQG